MVAQQCWWFLDTALMGRQTMDDMDDSDSMDDGRSTNNRWWWLLDGDEGGLWRNSRKMEIEKGEEGTSLR